MKATRPNCGKLLRALSPKPSWKHGGGQVNSLGYGNNDKDWTIRSQAPKFATDKNMEKVQRLDGCGVDEIDHLI